LVNTFEFARCRFHFRAVDAVHFPQGKSSNTLRGAFGMLLRESAPADVYARLFEPGVPVGRSPGGLADWPRPYLFRAAHLDGLTVSASGRFYFDVHLFDLRESVLESIRTAFEGWAETGVGPRRGRVRLERAEQLGLDDRSTSEFCRLDFEAAPEPVEHVCLRFLTPTELKAGGVVAERPEFAALFGRLRDRISTLRALYGPGPLEIDFRGMGERAAAIRISHCDLERQSVARKSGRTGQVHPLGGFTGTADYAGDLREFLPWLRAARWVGVGRHTAWGNGDVRVVIPREASEPDPRASRGGPEASSL